VETLIADGLASGLYEALSPELLPRSGAKFLLKQTGPQITSEQFDVAIYAIESLFGLGDYTGNIGIENDSQLYLSTQIAMMESGAVVQKHINSYFDPDIVGGQGLGLLFWAAKKEYNQPQFNNAIVDVITPGVASPLSNNLSVRQYLFFRTFVDRIVLPIVDQAIGDVFDPSDLTKILVANAGNALNTFGTFIQNGDVKGAMESIVDAFLSDLLSVPPGPITQAIGKKVGQGLVEEALTRLIAKVSARLVPGVGWLATALDTVGFINTATNVGKTILDLRNTPGTLEYEVIWPLEVTSVQPTTLCDDGEPKQLTIRGVGFAPIIERGLFGNRERRPVVNLKFPFRGRTETVAIAPVVISLDGTSMTVVIPSSVMQNAEGNILVDVEHRDLVVPAPEALTLESELRITELRPNNGGAGTEVVITGNCFSIDRLAMSVAFTGANGPIPATILSSSPTQVRVVAPRGVETGPVTLSKGNETSNGLTFTVSTERVSINFGDNGSANDDTYALFVDGILIHQMPQPTRSAGPFDLDLSPGNHTVLLRGITAPDAIGTYFISFSGNVTNVSGDPLTGSDLVAGAQKRYIITVGGGKRLQEFAPAPGIQWKE
jgi:hypothetical protein